MRMSRPAASSSKTRVVGAHRRCRSSSSWCARPSAPAPQIELQSVIWRRSRARATASIREARPSSSIDLDASRDDEMQALERLTLRTGGWPPVVVVTQTFDADVARTLLQMRVADFLVKPVQPVELVRTCARVAQARGAAKPTEAQIYTFLPAVGGAGVTTLAIQTALLLLNERTARPRLDLPGRSRFPARRLRRLSRSRAAARSQGNRAAAGAARPATAGSHAVAITPPACGDRGAEPAGRDALVRSGHGDAAARSRVVAFRLCRDRHAAHLVLLDRQRAARLQPAVHRQRNDGAEPASMPSSWSPRSASGLATGRSRRSSSTASSSACSRRAEEDDIEQALGEDFAGAIPNNYRLVREAIDRGVPLDEVKPGNKITQAAQEADRCRSRPRPAQKAPSGQKKLKLSFAR